MLNKISKSYDKKRKKNLARFLQENKPMALI